MSNPYRHVFRTMLLSGILAASAAGCASETQGNESEMAPDDGVVQVTVNEEESRVDVTIDGELFTAYHYGGEPLKKPVLYPIVTADAQMVTRGYPIDPRPGERVDHPHHLGLWLNYGDVNGLDFWNNSTAQPPERADQFGTIVHRSIQASESGDVGALDVTMEWLDPQGVALLREDTRFEFREDGNTRMIDRTTTLTALDQRVNMTDNKEGMFAIRVARELELPEDRPALLVGEDGQPMEERVSSNEGVSGDYTSSEGVTGGEVWGTRAKWMLLDGIVDGEPAALAILDHPDNVGYPTYWHARGYGLFAANPLGQAALSDGLETLDFGLDPGESTTFRYRVLVVSGQEAESDAVEQRWQEFAQ